MAAAVAKKPLVYYTLDDFMRRDEEGRTLSDKLDKLKQIVGHRNVCKLAIINLDRPRF